MSNTIFYSIEQYNGFIKFVNDSDHKLFIYQKPIKPKRTFQFIAIVQPNTFLIWEHRGFTLNITNLTFSFEAL